MKSKPVLRKLKKVHTITEYKLSSNGMRVLFVPKKNTGVITSDIVYKVGSHDEDRGETGLAHMLEHMLFKPTTYDMKRESDASAMAFEREYGVILNANTWKDRTSYFFSYPKEYFEIALRTEAERMQGVVLTDKEFQPEKRNVLSEYDMYAGDEEFALSVQMSAVAFQAHPYGHETIGHREDIEAYTVEKLKSFYKKFYTPENATLIIVGDINETDMRRAVITHFGNLQASQTIFRRKSYSEPKQEGLRTVTINRPSTTQLIAFGVKHGVFPSNAWFQTAISLNILAGDEDSLLHKILVDTGLATNIHVMHEPTREPNQALIFITLSKKATHEEIRKKVLEAVSMVTSEDVKPFLKRTIIQTLFQEAVQTESSLGLASKLVEYVSADAWEQFFNAEKTLKEISPFDIKKSITQLFQECNLTIGYFKGSHI